jgi:hypothetical protein
VNIRIYEKLSRAGDALAKDPLGDGTKSLASLQKELEQADVVTDGFSQFILFFLSLLIDDMRYNLLGDFPFSNAAPKEGDTARRELFQRLGQTLIVLSVELARAHGESCVGACSEITGKYLETIKELNRQDGKAQ